MKDFLSFRKEVYTNSYTGSVDEKRKNIENLYAYLVDEDQSEDTFKNALIDLISFVLISPQSDFSIEPYIAFFSQNTVYDNFFNLLIKNNKVLIGQIPPLIPFQIDILSTFQFRAWMNLFLDLKPCIELNEKTDVFFDHFIDDEYSIILQLKLLIYYLEEMGEPIRTSYIQLLKNICNSFFNSKGIIQYLKIIFVTINRMEPESLNEIRASFNFTQFLDNENLPDMKMLSSLMKEKITFLKGKGILLFQFLFYGDPEFSGSGDSGGLGILLRDLGSAISEKSDVAGVITFCLYDTAISKYPYIPITDVAEKHTVVRLPMYLGGSGKEGFIPYQGIIESELNQLICNLESGIHGPEIFFHVRYLDAASFILSRIAMNQNIPLIATLTPDPHRRLIQGQRETSNGNNLTEQLNDFYRVLIGDVLLENSSGIIGIGKKSIHSTLIPYYPQIIDKKNLVIEGIDEGINVNIKQGDLNLVDVLCRQDCELFFKKENIHRPVILNIGRLNEAKGQINLLKAWDEFNLWKTHNLILIGGDFDHPSSEEKSIIDTITDYINTRTYLQGKIRFQGSTANKRIRNIQNTIASEGLRSYPDVYLCSSIKEEFGISIIEAMSAGLLVMAPLLGGAKEYIHQGINGFLINTESSDSIGREFTSYIYDMGLSELQIKTIQKNARQTIINKYSLDKIADDFLQVYKRAGSKNEQ